MDLQTDPIDEQKKGDANGQNLCCGLLSCFFVHVGNADSSTRHHMDRQDASMVSSVSETFSSPLKEYLLHVSELTIASCHLLVVTFVVHLGSRLISLRFSWYIGTFWFAVGLVRCIQGLHVSIGKLESILFFPVMT